jgi:hypothetical protein
MSVMVNTLFLKYHALKGMKVVGMIRAEIGLKNRQIINETYSFRCFLFYKTFTPTTILVTIFHICTCDDVTLVNEKSIVS